MKIAHIISTYPPYRGGMGNVAADFVVHLRDKGHQVSVYTPLYNSSDSDSDPDYVKRIKPVFKYGNSAFIPKLSKMLGDVDIVHLHYPFFGGAETVAKFKKDHPKIPLVITYHMDVVGVGALKVFFKYYNKFLFPRIIKQADVILVSSLDYAKNSTILDCKKFNNIIEIPFGVDQDFIPLSKDHKEKEINLLFVGALDKAHYFKGLEDLIKAIQFVKAEVEIQKLGVEVNLQIIGAGDLRKKYERQVKDHSLENNIEFLGKVSKNTLVSSYQDADLTILPSIDRSEAFGIVLIESMACGTPVMASNLPGVRSVVDNNVSGVTIRPGQPIELAAQLMKLIQNKSLLTNMGEGAIKRVEENYRWPIIIEKLEKVYTDLLQNKRT